MPRKVTLKRIFALFFAIILVIASSASALATDVPGLTATTSGTQAPGVRYYVANSGWRFAEAMPLANAFDEVLYLDSAASANAVVSGNATVASLNQGKLTQFVPSAPSSAVYPATTEIVVPTTGDAKAAVDEKVLTFNSADFGSGSTEIVGFPTASLYLKAASAGTLTVLLEAVQADGSSNVIASGSATLVAGEQHLTVQLQRAYDDGQDDQDFVAYQFKGKSSSLRVCVYSSLGAILTVYAGGSKASTLTAPFVESDENGYSGELTLDGKSYNASMYWLKDNIFINYTVKTANDTWLSYPANSSYTVNALGAAEFGGFTFLPEGTPIANAAEQLYDGSKDNTQPFPQFRHIVVDVVDVQPLTTKLYVPGQKTLKYDIFMPSKTTTTGAPPIVLNIHGYGGSYSNLTPFLVELLSDGYAVAGIDLRNYPPNLSPDYYHDIKGNIRDIRANAAVYGIDPNRIGVMGESLGGNTALMMLVSADNADMEGTVGGNAGISSRVQAGIAGYGWSDMLNFGADQRADNASDPELLATMFGGGDGETSPIAMAIDFSGPGKGLMVLRHYLEARQAAEEAGTLTAFLAANYILTIDDAYIAKWFPGASSAGFSSGAVVTAGIYVYQHDFLMAKIAQANAASPLYYVSPDDPAIALFAGVGGRANITNTQSTRTLQALNDAGVEGLMFANTLGVYGNADEIVVAMKNYLNEYLMAGPSGVKIALTLDATAAAVNYVPVAVTNPLKKVGSNFMIPLDFVAKQLGVSIDSANTSTKGVDRIDGVLYGTAEYVKGLGAVVTVWDEFNTVIIYKADAVATLPKSPVVQPTKTSTYGQYSGYTTNEPYPGFVKKSVYVEVPASYSGASRSDPEYTGSTIKLALDYVLPADVNGKVIDGRFPTIVVGSRGGRFVGVNSPMADGVILKLLANGYAYVVIELRGCGVSFGVSNSFASMENRLDVKHIMENWIARQPWSNGKYGMIGGSNRGLIQQATAAVDPQGLLAITPVVTNADFYFQDYPNGVSAVPLGMSGSVSGLTPTPRSYEDFKASTKLVFVDEDTDGRMAYEAYVGQMKNKNFMSSLLQPNLLRDQEIPILFNEKANMTIPPAQYNDQIIKSGILQHQLAGLYDASCTFQVATTNAWGGTIVVGPWTHPGAIGGSNASPEYPDNTLDVGTDYLRWFDYSLKGIDNGYDQAPPFYYYVVGAGKGNYWRYSDNLPLENSNYSTLYLAPEDSDITVAAALKLNGAQSNNGKLTPDSPTSVSSTPYTVDTTVKTPEDYSSMILTTSENLIDGVDSKALTFTTAPLASGVEMVGIPTIDLWVSSENSNDADFIAYLEVVKADGTSNYLSRALIRASHRTTGSNLIWDATKGLTYHTSMTADVNARLAEGLANPTRLQFQFDLVSVKLKEGESIRVSVTCANTGLYQHPMYADKTPIIKLYQGGDTASSITLPIVENVSNTFNGTVTLTNGSYTGPGTLYMFEKNYYLNYNGNWKKLPVDSDLAKYSVVDNAAVFAKAGFSFLPEGNRVIQNGIAQNYMGGEANVQPFPSASHIYLDTVKVTAASDILYLPTSKTLAIDLFLPETATSKNKVPLLFYIHGFGGTTIDLPQQLQRITEAGYAVASIDLRNYPPNTSPDYYQDIKGSIRYMRANAKQYNIDPSRFGIYGVSLGGNTALMMLLSGDDATMEGTVGGNAGVSSRLQAGIVGFAWSDALNFGADQRTDTINNPAMLAKLLPGGDGEAAPCALAIDFGGPGKGLLVLRNYLSARAAAENTGTLGAFLATDYTLTIDDAYVEKYFSNVAAGAVTRGTYTYKHDLLMQKFAEAAAASPISYASPDDPAIAVFGGFGSPVNITNNQSVRTLKALQDANVLAFYYGNTLGNYGEPDSIQAAFMTYLDKNLMNKVGAKITMTVDTTHAVVNDASRPNLTPLKLVDGEPYMPIMFIADTLALDATAITETTEGVKVIDGALYGNTAVIENLTGAEITYYADYKMVIIESSSLTPVPLPEPAEEGLSTLTIILIAVGAVVIIALIILLIIVLRRRAKRKVETKK